MEQRYKKAEHGIELEKMHEFIMQHGETVCYDKGERFECEGEPTRWWGFVEKGYFKYTVRGISDGCEHIAWFSFEGEFVGAYPNLLDGSKAQFTIEAVVPCSVVRVSGEQLKQFFSQNYETLQLCVIMSNHILTQFQARYIDFHRAKPIERYNLLIQRCPGIVHDLSLKEISSFLNIAPQTLSRIRKAIAHGAKK